MLLRTNFHKLELLNPRSPKPPPPIPKGGKKLKWSLRCIMHHSIWLNIIYKNPKSQKLSPPSPKEKQLCHSGACYIAIWLSRIFFNPKNYL
jgi:hypothetical protein